MLPESEAKAKFASRFKVLLTVNQLVLPPNFTPIEFNTIIFDGRNEFIPTVGNCRFTPRSAGYYWLKALLKTATAIPVGRVVQTQLWLNGITSICDCDRSGDGTNQFNFEPCSLVYLTPNDAVIVRLLTNVVGGVTVLVGEQYSHFIGHRLS